MSRDSDQNLMVAQNNFAEAERQLGEALDLLALWYARWQGFVAGTPDGMQVRTRDLLTAHGRAPKAMVQR